MSKHSFVSSVVLFATVGCKPPPDAPVDLENLSEYIFAHMGDEDTAELEAGLPNLRLWLETDDNLESTLEGYRSKFERRICQSLDDVDRSIRDSLYGVVVAYEYEHSMKELKQNTLY